MATDPREETEAERLDRNTGELLQELRVAQTGVQILFAFLLTMPFTQRFSELSDGQITSYYVALLSAALAIGLLVGPVAFHRLTFRRGRKDELVRWGNAMALAGLATLIVSLSAAVGLVASVISGPAAGRAVATAVFVMLSLLWALPAALSLRTPEAEEALLTHFVRGDEPHDPADRR